MTWLIAAILLILTLFVGFATICVAIAANRAARRLPQALREHFDAPPTPEQCERAAMVGLMHEIAKGEREFPPTWAYDPGRGYYLPIDTPERIHAMACTHGQVKLLRYDAELQEFSQEWVTPDMPLAEIAG